MFYEPDKRNHGLPFNPFKALVVPRPIGWISTVDATGRANLAPFSFFNIVANEPPCVMFATSRRADGRLKDSQALAEESGEFVVNLAAYHQRQEMNQTSFPYEAGENEFDLAALRMEPSQLVRAPRVGNAPAHLECRYLQTVSLPALGENKGNFIVIGRVVGVHIDDSVIVDGRVDIARLQPLCRLGYDDYGIASRAFQMRAKAREATPT